MKNVKPAYIAAFIFLVLTLFSAINIYFFFKKKNLIVQKTGSNTNKIDHESILLTLERNASFLPMMDNNKPLNKELTFSGDSNTNIRLSEFLNGIKTPKLILRYAEISCTPCVDSSIATLKEMTNKIGETNILILASYRNKKDLSVWKRVNNIKYPVYQIPYNQIGLNIDSQNIPYFFLLLPDNSTVYQLFLPLKENTKRTKEYLALIAARYFEKSNKTFL